ncbi:MAG: hypothetical protein ACREUN_17075 [Burkholderiales bacterium]
MACRGGRTAGTTAAGEEIVCARQRRPSYARPVFRTGSRAVKMSQDYLGFKDARSLFARLQKGEAFHAHLQDRLRLVIPALALCALIAFASAAATAIFFLEISSWLVLPAFLLAAVVLAGSLFVQGLVFLSWLERRALALALGHRPRDGRGELPRVPWLLAALVLFIPLALLASLAPLVALVLAAAGALVPFLYARLDRAANSRLTRPRAAV